MPKNHNNWEWNACDMIHYFKSKIDNLENIPIEPVTKNESAKPAIIKDNMNNNNGFPVDPQITESLKARRKNPKKP